MPQGKGTYGRKRGRPPKNAPAGKKPTGRPLARTAPKAKPKPKPKPKANRNSSGSLGNALLGSVGVKRKPKMPKA